MREVVLRFTVVLVLAATFLTVVSARGDVFYLRDYPAWQGGYDLSGSITTDGAAVLSSEADILSWNFQVSLNGVEFYGASSTDSGGPATNFVHNVVVIQSSIPGVKYLTLAPGTATSYSDLQMSGSGSATSILWDREHNFAGPTNSYIATDVYVNPSRTWATGPTSLGSDPNVPAGDWIIAATVPEPGTLTLLVSALLGVGAFYLRRRRAAGKEKKGDHEVVCSLACC